MKHFGKDHLVTKLSANITQFIPNLIYPIEGWLPPAGTPEIELVQGFDHSNVSSYIT
jgi:hypothetical protein